MPVAVKIIDKIRLSEHPKLYDLVENEIFINKSLNHENIVGFYESIATDS